MSKIPFIFIIIFLSLGLSSCAPVSTTKTTTDQVSQELEANALTLMQQAEYQQAATEYLHLADEYPEYSTQFRLKAATAYFEATDYQTAKQTLEHTDINNDVFPIQTLQKRIILAKIALAEQNTAQALTELEIIPAKNTPTSILITYHETRAQAFDQQQNISQSIDERLNAYAISDGTNETNIRYKKLWQQLSTLDLAELELKQITTEERSQSWLALAIISIANSSTPQNLKTELQDWQNTYPSHLANQELVPELLEKADRIFSKPETIALLLPFTGKYQTASKAVREGFFSAWTKQTADKPEIRLYDTTASNIQQTYQQAIDDGANFVVGPLKKENILKLVNSDTIQVKTLVLNYLDESAAENKNSASGITLFQFGLSPEQEAAQVAKRASIDGHSRALIITPDTSWGKRQSAAFAKEFTQLGGTVLEQANYNSREEDYNLAVKSLLNTDLSKQRADSLVEVLKLRIESETRRRQDADVIFLAAKHRHAKQIVPQLYFERAKDIPIYATSNIYIFTSDSEEYVDMNNIKFTDIPWILAPEPSHRSTKAALENYWPNASITSHRLYAMGYDAYTIITKFPQLSANENYFYLGATGSINMDKAGKIYRKLKWAKIENGKALVIEDTISQY